MPRHASTHAAGVVITREPATEYVPLSTNDGLPVTQFNMVEIERLGLLKMDFGPAHPHRHPRYRDGRSPHRDPDFRVANIDYDDPATYEMLTRGETMGIFQLESTGMTQVLDEHAPEKPEDVIALISLYRPGPMDSIPTYLRNRKDPVGRLPDPADGPYRGCDQRCPFIRSRSCRSAVSWQGSVWPGRQCAPRYEQEKAQGHGSRARTFVHGCTEPGKECAAASKNGIPRQWQTRSTMI